VALVALLRIHTHTNIKQTRIQKATMNLFYPAEVHTILNLARG